jgi:hypothetical protein
MGAVDSGTPAVCGDGGSTSGGTSDNGGRGAAADRVGAGVAGNEGAAGNGGSEVCATAFESASADGGYGAR